MSRPVDERLRELEADLQDLRFLPAAAVRARGRQRGRRQLAAVMTTAAAVTATASITVAWPHQAAAPVGDRPGLKCVLALPDDPAEVHIRLLAGGASDAVAAQLRARRFAVQTGSSSPGPVAGAAELRYGPAAIGAASVLRAEVRGEVTMTFDPGRGDDVIDLAVGPAFTGFASATEVNQKLALAGEPTAPPQC